MSNKNSQALVLGIIGGGLDSSGSGAPAFVSAEIGTVNGYTVVVTFDAICVTPPSVTIKENGVVTTHDGGTIQGDAHIVYYVIPIPWHGSGDVITVDDNAVTNNIVWEALLDLQADALILNNNDPVLTWTNVAETGGSFTAAGTARPIFHTDANGNYIEFDGLDDIMTASAEIRAALDNLASFAVILILNQDAGGVVIGKSNAAFTGGLWTIDSGATNFYIQKDDLNYIFRDNVSGPTDWHIKTLELLNRTDMHVYYNGSNSGEGLLNVVGSIDDYSNSNDVTIGWLYDSYSIVPIKSAVVIAPTISSADRAALETRLGARYGLTVP